MATIQRAYEANRDLVNYVENKSGTTSVSKYDYTLDTLGRRILDTPHGFAGMNAHAFAASQGRIGLENTGTVWGALARCNVWTYNNRSELATSKRYFGTYPPSNPNNDLIAERRIYNYDNIGNRLDMTALFTSYYCTNNVNQYTATDNDYPNCPSPTESF
ncbi:MAG: hypothetical protein HY718_06025, partial [Planctomycetes bacterium]|nr:hypothetical protein [Planctomycetota bacterium]